MAKGSGIFFSALTVVLAASLYQLYLKEFFTVSFGFGRIIQPLEEFPYNCRRLKHERLEACEDLWLDDEKRVLYAACTGTNHRLHWNQAIGNLNASGRRPGGGEIIALDIDKPGPDGLFGMRAIKTVGYVGPTGGKDKDLDLVGFDAQVVDANTIHFYLVNQRPPVDSEFKILDNLDKIGANSTIDVLELERGDDGTMKHLRTISSSQVWSPNRVAIIGDGAFVVTNDHSAKIGFRKSLDPILGGGNVAYCSLTGECHAATPSLVFPNGLARGKDGLIYVPSSVDGKVRVYSLDPESKLLNLVDVIALNMPLDNLRVDRDGDIWAVGFPNLLKLTKALKYPFEHSAPSTIFRIKGTKDGYDVQKVLEDDSGRVLSGVTTAVHDAQTGTLWFGAALSPYLAICEPK